MSTLEERIQNIEDRLALQDLIVNYCVQIDSGNLDGVVDCFAEDAELDLSGLGLPSFTGQGDIRDFFASVFNVMKHNGHYSTNFKINKKEGDAAYCQSYVYAVGKAHDGSDVLVHAKHQFECVKTTSGWKIKRFTEPYLVPPVEVSIPDFSGA